MRGLLLSFGALCCALSLPGWAGRAVSVYEVDVAERSGTALQDAMRQALVRATGHREAAEDPALGSIVAEAPKFVKNYATGPRGESQVVFDGPAVEQAITAAGRSVWDSDRPFTLVVLDPPRARGPAAAARVQLDKVAAERGLPISLIPLTLVDAQGKPLTSADLEQALQHYGADELLVGRGEGTAPDSALQWTLYSRGTNQTWTGPLGAGIDHTVDQLVPQPGTTPSQAESDVHVRIEGVNRLADYANVARLLQATPGVRRANIADADAGSVLFDVSVRGGAAGLEQALAGQSRLARGSQNVYRYQPQG